MTNTPAEDTPNASEPSGAAPDYRIGYGKPPVHSQVKPGQVLNPKGRPKGQRNIKTVLRETLNERTRIREGDRTRSVTKLDAIILRMVNDAALGNSKAQDKVFKLAKEWGLTAPPNDGDHEHQLNLGILSVEQLKTLSDKDLNFVVEHGRLPDHLGYGGSGVQ
jgi:hypothetical protein